VHESNCPDKTDEMDHKKDEIKIRVMDLPYFCDECKIIFGSQAQKAAHDYKNHQGNSSIFHILTQLITIIYTLKWYLILKTKDAQDLFSVQYAAKSFVEDIF